MAEMEVVNEIGSEYIPIISTLRIGGSKRARRKMEWKKK